MTPEQEALLERHKKAWADAVTSSDAYTAFGVKITELVDCDYEFSETDEFVLVRCKTHGHGGAERKQ